MFASCSAGKCNKSGKPAGPANSSRRRPSRCFRADDAAGEGDCPRSHERGSQPRRAGWPREPQRRRLLDGPAARAAEPPAGGAWTIARGAMHKSRGRRWQRAARGACLRASAIAGAAGLGGAMRANGAPTRPQAASGGMGGGAPHESARRWRPQRRWLRRPQARSAQRLPTERPLPPHWDTVFRLGPEGARGGRGERAQRAAGEGGAGRHRRARIKARP